MDFTANGLGTYSVYIGDKYPFLKEFKLKLSYHRSERYNSQESFIKDYQGMTFWLTYQLNNLMPENMNNILPDFLNLAVGYGVDKPHGSVEIYLAPDINLTRLIKTNNRFLNKTIHFLDYVHIPLFTWKMAPQTKFYYFYF